MTERKKDSSWMLVSHQTHMVSSVQTITKYPKQWFKSHIQKAVHWGHNQVTQITNTKLVLDILTKSTTNTRLQEGKR